MSRIWVKGWFIAHARLISNNIHIYPTLEHNQRKLYELKGFFLIVLMFSGRKSENENMNLTFGALWGFLVLTSLFFCCFMARFTEMWTVWTWKRIMFSLCAQQFQQSNVHFIHEKEIKNHKSERNPITIYYGNKHFMSFQLFVYFFTCFVELD